MCWPPLFQLGQISSPLLTFPFQALSFDDLLAALHQKFTLKALIRLKGGHQPEGRGPAVSRFSTTVSNVTIVISSRGLAHRLFPESKRQTSSPSLVVNSFAGKQRECCEHPLSNDLATTNLDLSKATTPKDSRGNHHHFRTSASHYLF